MAADPRMTAIEADITGLAVDAVVNAANERLAPGGGVCGAIHRAAGPGLAADCAALVARDGPCPTGEARITPGHGLKARFVIHAVGPVWHGGGAGEAALLAGAYRNSLILAARNGARTIAFPAISTGIFGYPADQAAKVAVGAVAEFLASDTSLTKVVFCCFGADSRRLHEAALATLS